MRTVVLTAALAAVIPLAHAGRSCEPQALTPATLTQGLNLAVGTARALDASGARVVLLARAGQDLSKYGLRYSHMGWAYKTDGQPWRVAHKLNHCGSADAFVYRQGLGDFFLDDLWRYEAVWAVPTPEIQERLLALLQDKARTTALQHQPYNMVSYPWSTKYQQSNQWAIETLAAAMEPAGVRTREQAQAWLRLKGYTPSVLKIGALTRLGARVGSANIAFDDHPNDKRYSDQIETVTVDSVLAWMERSQMVAQPVLTRP